MPYDKVCELYGKKEWPDKIDDLYTAVKNAGVKLKQETLELIIITLCGQVLETFGFQDKTQIFEFFSKTQADLVNRLTSNLEIIKSDKSINTFIDYYFESAANILISGAACDKQFNNYEDVIKRAFGKIIEKGNLDKLTDSIIFGIKKSKADPILFILFIFRKHLSASPNILDKKLGDIAKNYFEKLSSGERKKIFSELLASAEQTEIAQFERFFEEFNKEHKGGLFGFLKNK